MKKNVNKGFLLVETLVVATFCITVLVMLFLQFRTLMINYNNSFKYNTVEGIYKLDSIKKCIYQNEKNSPVIKQLGNKNYIFIAQGNEYKNNIGENNLCSNLVKAGEFKTIIYTNDTKLSGVKEDNGLDRNLSKFIKQLKNQGKPNRLIAEFQNGTFASIAYDNTSDPEFKPDDLIKGNAFFVSNVNDPSNDCTFDNPCNLQNAYQKAVDDVRTKTEKAATIYIIDDYSVDENNNGPLLITDNIEITLLTYDYDKKIHSISSSGSTSMISMEKGTLNLLEITLDGKENASEPAIITHEGDEINITINKNTTIQNVRSGYNNRVGNGGALHLDGKANVLINDGLFTNNEGRAGGAIHIGINSSVILNKGTISNNKSAVNNGGAISGTGTFVMNGGTISNNTSNANAGAIFSSGGKVDIQGGTISNNKALNTSNGNGGGIYTEYGNLTISGSASIKSNEAINGGGVYYKTDSNGALTLNGGTISENTATTYGGGLYLLSPYSSGNKLTAGSIIKNTAVRGGGIFVGNNSFLTLQGTTIGGSAANNNIAKDYGGGIFGDTSSQINMSSGTISYNKTNNESGGGIYSKGSKLTITGGSISNNTSKTAGGGLMLNFGVDTAISNATLSANAAGTNGGAIYMATSSGSTNTKVTLNSGNITKNTATNGGGIYLGNPSTLVIKGGTIGGSSANKNTASGAGGGVYGYTNTAISMSGGTVSYNAANGGSGGGIYTRGNTFSLTGGTITRNTCSDNGGGVLIQGGAQMTMTNASITYNTAAKYGGGLGIYDNLTEVKGTKATMSSGNINNNTATNNGGGGVCIAAHGTFILKGGNIKNNSAGSSAGGIYKNAASGTYKPSGSPSCTGNGQSGLTSACVWSSN